MVMLSTVATFILFKSLFSRNQFMILIMIMPTLMTLTEAWAPHTWDNPFQYLVASVVIYLVLII
jgi:phytol kinase